MGAFLLTLITGVAAGALTARFVARREIEHLRETLGERQPAPGKPVVASAPAVAPAPVAPPSPAVADEVTPEILMVLSAAVAAFLGKRARIRGARPAQPASSSAWAQQGRVYVQASHNLPHGRR
jgi:methylmalonyl-CoA carboxyltransferase large subunit